MRFLVHGTRTEVVSLEIEADDIDEAMGIALSEQFSGRDVEVWDSSYVWDVAMLNE